MSEQPRFSALATADDLELADEVSICEDPFAHLALCKEAASWVRDLTGELRLAMLAFKRIEQEPRTPTKMRDIAGARATYVEMLLAKASPDNVGVGR